VATKVLTALAAPVNASGFDAEGTPGNVSGTSGAIDGPSFMIRA